MYFAVLVFHIDLALHDITLAIDLEGLTAPFEGLEVFTELFDHVVEAVSLLPVLGASFELFPVEAELGSDTGAATENPATILLPLGALDLDLAELHVAVDTTSEVIADHDGVVERLGVLEAAASLFPPAIGVSVVLDLDGKGKCCKCGNDEAAHILDFKSIINLCS